MNTIEVEGVIEITALKQLASVRHGFFGRSGGQSSGIYASNNCGFGAEDDPAQVAANRDRCIARLGLAPLVTVTQRHTATVMTVETPWERAAAPVADALVTARRGLALGILTADCVPVLLADAGAGIVAAAHAGWRGAFDGVIATTVDAMVALGAAPHGITAAVGPCIGAASYEVGPEFMARFVTRDPAYARYFARPGDSAREHFDLPAFVADRLRAAGVGHISVTGRDTCADEHTFFSYRRSTLRGEPDYGRQLSVIGLAPS